MLKALGLDRLAESVYLALLRRPDSGLSDIVGQLGADEAAVRAALDDLARLQLLRMSWEDPEAIRPVSPEVGLAALLAREQTELARRHLEIEESRAAVARLLASHAELRPKMEDPEVERLIGIDAVRDRLVELASSCRWEACSLMPGGAQSAASLEASRQLDADAISRGVRLRTVYLDSVRNDPPTMAYAKWLRELGSEVRTAPTLPLRMLIVDRELALVPVDSESNSGALLLSGQGIVTALVALFTTVWNTALPLGSSPVRDDRGLSTQEENVLKLLGDGHTDEVIARQLGVSVRTARRITADLMQRLGARSRFQAGALSAARGWIRPEEMS
ncbi:helix-turn-helix domain-containing protein [Longispora albida]|uniref:helix-turn-helix domain-containing protein n=1 Tax=Longispora albida TaxID=203523 RepID=UPI000373DA0D|nr:helix-turn-helix transcriptional regulator [Longispora albida]